MDPHAERELAAIWLKTANRKAVTSAANRIDLELAKDPENFGESRPNGRRIHFCAPLGVIYRVVPGSGQVRVQEVWEF